MSLGKIALIAVDEAVLVELLAVAVSQAKPVEVMAPGAGPPGWTQARRDAFVEYHRSRRANVLSDAITEATFAVTIDGAVVGAARLAAVDDDPAVLEVGLWLGRRSRGAGIAGAVLPVVANVARRIDASRLIARTSSANDVAVAALRRGGFALAADANGHVEAALPLG